MQQPSLSKQLKMQSEILLAERKSNQHLRFKLARIEEDLSEESLYLQELQRKLHQERERARHVLRQVSTKEETEKLANLEALLQERGERIKELQVENKMLEAKCQELQTGECHLNERFSKAKELIERQGEAILSRQQEILSLEVDVASLREELKVKCYEKEAAASALSKELQAKESLFHELEKKLAQEEELHSYKERFQAAEVRVVQLQEELEKKLAQQDELHSYKERFQAAEARVVQLQEELEKKLAQQDELHSYKERFQTAEARAIQLQEELEKGKGALFEKTQLLDVHFHRVSELTLELKNVKEQSQRSHQQIEELHSELRIAQQHLAKKLKEITDLKAQLDRERIEKGGASERAEQYVRRFEELVKESERKESIMREESSEREKRFQSAQRELSFAAKEIAKKSEAVEHLTKEVDRLRSYEAQMTQIRSLFGQAAPPVEPPKPTPVEPKQSEPLLFGASSGTRIRSTLFEE